ncbi:MAG: hypothetical protein M1840_008746 [Geoglossum simile]|nr:MAG: hypothetical protein M1840_008746 [Geoglossum simile]
MELLPSLFRGAARQCKIHGWVCSRCLSTTWRVASGHNRWSTIKHDKGKNDAQKNRLRSVLAKELTLASKLFGQDLASNPRLATAITTASKAGFPKASISAAISRGQGISASGTALESLTIECIGPGTVAIVIDCQTDNKARTLQDLRLVIKSHGGTATPTSYMFSKRGRVVFERREHVGVNEVFDDAVEAGAEDVDVDKFGNIIVRESEDQNKSLGARITDWILISPKIFTEPSKTISAATTLAHKRRLEILSSNIVWDANEDTKVSLETTSSLQELLDLIENLHEYSSVQGIYLNASQGSIDDAAWTELQSRVAV